MYDQPVLEPHPDDDSSAGFFDCRGEWQPLDGCDSSC